MADNKKKKEEDPVKRALDAANLAMWLNNDALAALAMKTVDWELTKEAQELEAKKKKGES